MMMFEFDESFEAVRPAAIEVAPAALLPVFGPWLLSASLHAAVAAAMLVGVVEAFVAPALFGTTSVVTINLAASIETPHRPEPLPGADDAFRDLPAAESTAMADIDLPAVDHDLAAPELVLPPETVLAQDADAEGDADDDRKSDPQAEQKSESREPPSQGSLASIGSTATTEVLGTDDTMPQVINNKLPEFPGEALRNRWQGTVMLRVSVRASGEVRQVVIYSTSGFAILDESALKAVRSWRFRPARRGRDAVEATVLLPVVFQLSAT